MGFGQAIASCFSKFFVWRDRASRSEFWWWVLFTVIVGIVAGFLDAVLNFKAYTVATPGDSVIVTSYSIGWLSTAAAIILFFPTLAVTVRRLHDTNHSGWWWWLQLLNFLCLIGTLILVFAFYIRASDPGPNRYGPPPE